jgi:ATP-binding cassette subfamily C protein
MTSAPAPPLARPADASEIPLDRSGAAGLRLGPGDPLRIVEGGRVELFYAERAGATGLGPRRFLVGLDPGDPVPGLGTIGEELGVAFFAVGSGARLRAVTPTVLGGPSADRMSEPVALVASWVERLAGRIALEHRPPARAVPLPVGEVVNVPSGVAARPDAGLCWVRLVDGRCGLRGRRDLELIAGETVPVSPGLWLESWGDGAAVRCRSTADAMADGGVLPLIDRVTRRLLTALIIDDRRAGAVESERLAGAADRDRRRLADAAALLGRVFEPGRPRDLVGTAVPGTPLVEACRLAGAAVGVRIVSPPEHAAGRGARLRDPVEAVARASKVRTRMVLLAGEWWTRDHGALVGFAADDGHPVALLRRRRTGYTLHDPASRTVVPVTRAVAETLRPQAYMFFPSFGHRRLALGSLARAGLRGVGRELGGVLLLSAVAACLALATPLLSQILFDAVVPQADRPQVPVIGAVLVVFAVTATAFGLVRGLLLLRLEATVELNMEAALMDRLLRLPAAFFREHLTGDLAQRILGISAIRRALTGTVVSAMLSGVFSLVSLGLVIYYDARLALLGGALAVIALLVILTGSVVALRHNRVMTDRSGRIAGLVLQLLSAISKLRTAGAEGRAFAVWAGQFAEQKRHAFRAGAVLNHFTVFTAAFPLLASMAFFAAIHAATGPGGDAMVSTGAFIAVMAAFAQLLAGMLGLGASVIAVLRIVPQYERLRPILTRRPEAEAERVDPGPLRGAIEVTHLTFRYPGGGGVVLNDVSLDARPGEMVAVVGPSGSGKSTLIRLLLGFERPEAGAVCYDGRDLAGLDLDGVRRQCGVVLQHGRLMPGDVLGNIVGPWNLSLEHAWAAARMVGLEDDLRALPMGMFTLVSEDGGAFSGGQRQRLLLARAIVHEPAVLFLDEATSALDNRTQAVVSESLARLRVTRLVIAHRLSTIKDADRIYVLDGGRVVESGTYHSLLQAGGAFADLARRQLL